MTGQSHFVAMRIVIVNARGIVQGGKCVRDLSNAKSGQRTRACAYVQVCAVLHMKVSDKVVVSSVYR
jgi:hypothetical protein